MKKHSYKLEIDTIEGSGAEAIQKTCEIGNNIYLNLNEIERRSQDYKDRYSQQFKLTLEYINKNGEFCKGETGQNGYRMPSGGMLYWNEPKNIEVIHLTRDPTIKSKLKREGLKEIKRGEPIATKGFQDPYFLNFGPEILEQGIVDLTINEDISNLNLNYILENNRDLEFYNNQILRVNTSNFYNINFELIESLKGSGKYRLNDEEGTLNRINPENIQSIFKKANLRNLEQQLLFQQLTNENIEMCIVSGGSGSGKTVVPYAAAIEQILSDKSGEKSRYEGIILFKSNDLIGGDDRNDGYRPGSQFEKTMPFLKSYIDAHKLIGLNTYGSFIEMLASPKDKSDEFGIRSRGQKFGSWRLPEQDRAIEIEYLQFARGRTFENKFIIVDEAQNYSPFEIKQLIERVGVGSKIVLIGDPVGQIDNKRLNPQFNGLTYAAKVNIGVHPRFSMLHLTKNYRSQSAEIMRNTNAPRD